MRLGLERPGDRLRQGYVGQEAGSRLYVDPVFFDAAACARIRAAMDRGEPETAGILRQGIARDDSVRQASEIDVDADTVGFVEACLDARRDALAHRFLTPLDAREGPGFLRYGPGGFYRPHRDRGGDPSWPGGMRREVAIVAFLNTSLDRPASGDFSGGVLRLLDLDARNGPVEIVPTRGALVAFPAETLHEVAPVLAGTRDVVVDWFYGPAGPPRE